LSGGSRGVLAVRPAMSPPSECPSQGAEPIGDHHDRLATSRTRATSLVAPGPMTSLPPPNDSVTRRYPSAPRHRCPASEALPDRRQAVDLTRWSTRRCGHQLRQDVLERSAIRRRSRPWWRPAPSSVGAKRCPSEGDPSERRELVMLHACCTRLDFQSQQTRLLSDCRDALWQIPVCRRGPCEAQA
jgi:hypothetical protein